MKACITGRNGLIGGALWARLSSLGWDLTPIPSADCDYIFHFGSPSSTVIFDKCLDYCVDESVHSFLSLVRFCRDNKVKLIYASSSATYANTTTYGKCKSALEALQHIYSDVPVLALRPFVIYGPNEEHKGEYASTLYQLIKSMAKGERPVLYGDGTQTRDFIYIDDAVDAIIDKRDEVGFADIGTGTSYQFKDLVGIINEVLGTNLEPVFVGKPKGYIEENLCKNPYKCKVDIREGIRRTLK